MINADLAAARDTTPRRKKAVGREQGSIQSVDRALTILETIAAKGGECALTELAQSAGLNVSTCHHLLSTLVARGYAAKVKNGRNYALGARILHLSHACQQMSLPHRATPYVERLGRVTAETVHLSVLQGDHVVTLMKRESTHAVRVDAGSLGVSNALHATAPGKAMLAWLPEAEIRRIGAAGGMTQFTPATITDIEDLIEALRIVRRSGFAMEREEFQPGVISFAVAVRDHSGGVIGAISVSAPAMRATKDHLAMLCREVVSAARELSAEMGDG